MSDRAIASIAVSLAAAGIAWAAPGFAGLIVVCLAICIYNVWSNA